MGTQFAQVFSNIAKREVPLQWRELLPSLVHLLQTQAGDVVLLAQTLNIYKCVIDVVSTKFIGTTKVAFQQAASSLLVPAYTVWSTHLSTLLSLLRTESSSAGDVGSLASIALTAFRAARTVCLFGFPSPSKAPEVHVCDISIHSILGTFLIVSRRSWQLRWRHCASVLVLVR